MTVIVQKFGGTSVGSIERIRHAAKITQKAYADGFEVVVVVSAMSGETDRLIQMACAMNGELLVREYDALVSTGERVSAALFSMALNELGIPACSLSGGDAGILTANPHGYATISDVDTERLKTCIQQKLVPVVTGFQGVNAIGDVTTIGRGGSDISAVALAAALKADECQIYTDVDGVYTSDPRVVPSAKRLDFITYKEMLVLSELGAKVLHRQAVEFAKRYEVLVRVLSSFSEGPGTVISPQGAQVEPWVSGVAFDGAQAKITILDIPVVLAESDELSQLIIKAPFEIDMQIINHASSKAHADLSFTVHKNDYARALVFSKALAKQFRARDVLSNDQVAKLSLVGLGMHAHAGVASKILEAFSHQGIGIHLISSTECKVSTVIDAQHMEQGANLLHHAFELNA